MYKTNKDLDKLLAEYQCFENCRFPRQKCKRLSDIEGVFEWAFWASRFLARSTFSKEKMLHANNREAVGASCFTILSVKYCFYTVLQIRSGDRDIFGIISHISP